MHSQIDETFVADRHQCHVAAKFGVFLDEDHCQFPTLYWSPKLHKRRVLLLFSSSCTTSQLSILLTFCLTAIKNHVIKYCTTVYESNGKVYFGLLKIQVSFLIILKSKGFLASSLHMIPLLYILRCRVI